MTGPRVLFVGNAEAPEFAAALAILRSQASWITATTIESVPRDLPSPDLLILASQWRGEFRAEAVEQLRARFPLAGVIHLIGAWLEGEVRSGTPWPGVFRLPASQTTTLARGIAQLARGQTPIWSLPEPATEEDRVLACRPPTLKGSGVVLIQSSDTELRTFLANAFTRRGFSTAVIDGDSRPPTTSGAVLAILDNIGTFDDQQIATAIKRLKAATTDAPVIVLAGFVRVEDREAALAAGAAAVLAKPFLPPDLFWEVRQLLEIQSSHATEGD